MHRHPRFARAAASAALLALGLLAGCGTYTSGGYYSSGYGYYDPAVAYGYPYYRSPRYYYGGGPGYYYGHPHAEGWHGGGAVGAPAYVPSQPGLGFARPVVAPPPVVRPAASPVFSHPMAMPPAMARPPMTVAPAGGFHR